MHKLTFNLALRNNTFREVTGWGFTLRAPNGRTLEFGLHKSPRSEWYISEISTGYLVGHAYETRNKAMKDLTPEKLEQISQALEHYEKQKRDKI